MKHSTAPWDSSVSKKGIVVLGERVPVTPEQAKRFGCDPCSVVAPTICTVAIGNPNREADAALIVAAPELLAACKLALEHVRELREAWRTGALDERDGGGGTRSNRNVDAEVALREAINKAEAAP